MRNPLIAELRVRLREMDEERDHLVALIALYEKREHQHAQNGAGASERKPIPFVPVRGGPTDRIKAVLAQDAGLSYTEVVERAKAGMSTTAANPERSIGSTLQSLVRRGIVERRERKHYLAQPVKG